MQKKRLIFGQRSQNVISRFILDIPKDTIIMNNTYRDQDVPEFL